MLPDELILLEPYPPPPPPLPAPTAAPDSSLLVRFPFNLTNIDVSSISVLMSFVALFRKRTIQNKE